jgi:23S rRNA (pseudouridine1915-N3)-methyltransferase
VKIKIVSVGKLKEKYLIQGINEYLKRLQPYAKVGILEVPDEKAPENLSDAEIEIVKNKEGERILKNLSPDTYVIALAIEGKMLSSEDLAAAFEDLMLQGKSDLTMVIGGSNGLSDEVLRRADFKWSFSKLTFPHQLMRLILVEQIYRAFKIIKGEPYHK